MIRKVRTTKPLPGTAEEIWQVVTDYKNLGWRGDLASIRVTHTEGGVQVTETLRNQMAIQFLVTVWQPPREYRQDMKGDKVSRSWGVVLQPGDPGKTQVTVVEEYHFSTPLLGLLSYLYLPVRSGQKRYLKMLGQRLKELRSQALPMELDRDKEEYCDAKQSG